MTGALFTLDAADLSRTVAELRRERVRTSVLSLSAEVHAFKLLAHATDGTFTVALDKEHMRRLLLAHVPPAPVEAARAAVQKRAWIRMGFPDKSSDSLSYCSCHTALLISSGYICPRCGAKYCELPTDCRVCSQTLASAPQLARTYHHLFPVPAFPEVAFAAAERDSAPDVECSACGVRVEVAHAMVVQCPQCTRQFCFDCDVYIHTVLHNCPGCLIAGGSAGGGAPARASLAATAAAAVASAAVAAASKS